MSRIIDAMIRGYAKGYLFGQMVIGFFIFGASLSGVADRLVAFEEFGVGGVGQLNPPRRSRINPA